MAGMCAVIAARVFDHRTLDRMEAAVDVADRQPAVRRGAPVPGARRSPDAAGALRFDRGTADRLRRRRQQRRRVARVRRRALGCRAGRRVARGLRARRGDRRARPQPRRHDRAGDRSPRRGARRRRGVHRRLDVDGPGDRARTTAARVRGLHRRRCADGRGREPDAVFLHCLPAHRGEEVAADGDRRPAVARVAAGGQPDARGRARCWPTFSQEGD